MKECKQIITNLSEISSFLVNVESDNKDDLSKLQNLIHNLNLEGKQSKNDILIEITDGISYYIDKLISKEQKDLKPIFESILFLKALMRTIKNEKTFTFDSDDIIQMLKTDKKQPDEKREPSIYDYLDKVVSLSVHLEYDSMEEMGEILNNLDMLHKAGKKNKNKELIQVTYGLREYIKKLVMGEIQDTTPISEGVLLLKSILMCMKNDKHFIFDITDVIKMLNKSPKTSLKNSIQNEQPKKEILKKQIIEIKDKNRSSKNIPKTNVSIKEKPIEKTIQEVVDLEEEDTEILVDFIGEATDNLESIEVNLVNLEEAPDDKGIINDIFRPFHTIKGVSAFLNLKKINTLAHSTENLLDSARNGELLVDHEITDLILESVDLLKQLINRVDEGVSIGKTAKDSDINVSNLQKRIQEAGTVYANDKTRIGDILLATNSVSEEDLDECLTIQKEVPDKKLGEILVETTKAKTKNVITAIRVQKKREKRANLQVKVDTEKLDGLVDLTGELVIAQSILKQQNLKQTSQNPELLQSFNQLGQIVSYIQKTAMSMRMIPIKATFTKMVRLIRDLARNTGKSVALKMSGEDTEIDRNLVEAMYEPMVHMIRNSVDHGLELSPDRVKAGKDPKGTVHLRAYHKGGNIVIEIEDDGKGLNKERILDKAFSSGLLKEAHDMTDAQIYDLVMQPGFSTAKEITDVSGRGVGMDVVKTAIEKQRGSIDIRSTPGKGSCFTITLPLTLAIIDGMLLRVSDKKYVLPTLSIIESFRPSKDEYFTVKGKGEMILARGSLIPLIRLEKICGVKGDTEKPWEGLVVIIEHKDKLRGLLIDELLGKDEFVIKSLGESFKNIKELAGCAILGDGTVGLILDISGIFEISSGI